MTSSTGSIEAYEIWVVSPRPIHPKNHAELLDYPKPIMTNDFSELLQSLTAADIQFIVVGGVAVALNGYVRATEDVAIIVEPSRENIEKLLGALAS